MAEKLKSLSLSLAGNSAFDWDEVQELEAELDSCHDSADLEAILLSFELPVTSPTSQEAVKELHICLALRAVVSAARGGSLRRLVCDNELQHVFAIPSLLPCWVEVDFPLVGAGWLHAAASLRPLIVHASLHLDPRPGAFEREDRRLTTQEVQSLHFYYDGNDDAPREIAITRSVKRYLSWLAEDTELAERVSTVWNAVVERGEADAISLRPSRLNWDILLQMKLEAMGL